MRDLYLIEQKNVVRYTDVTTTLLQETLEISTGLFWLDIEQMTEEDAAFLSEFKEFEFHPLSLKACQGGPGRSYLEAFPNHLFMMFNVQEDMEAEPARLCIFLTGDYLVTVRSRPMLFAQRLKDRIEQDYLLMRSPGYSMALLLHGLVDHLEGAIPQIEAELDTLTGEINEGVQPEHLQQIGQYKKRLSGMRRLFKTHGEVVDDLLTRTSEQLQPETILQIHSVHHRLSHIVEMLDIACEGLDTVNAMAATRTSQQLSASIARLTTVSAIFLPVIAVAALLGVNDGLVEGLEPLALVGAAVIVSIIVSAIVAMASRQR